MILKTRRVVVISLLISSGIILHILEAMIPLGAIVPGAKPGLANIVNLIGLVFFGAGGALQILLLRIFLGSFLSGFFMSFSFYLSLSGGLLGYLAMCLLYYYQKNKFSLLGISVAGAVFHNIGQVIAAYLIIKNPGIFYYLPFLTLLAIPTGIGVGLVAMFVIDYLRGGWL